MWGNEIDLRMVIKHLKCLGVFIKTFITSVVNVECLHVLFKPSLMHFIGIHFSMHVYIYNEYFIRHIVSHHFDVKKKNLLEFFLKKCLHLLTWLEH